MVLSLFSLTVLLADPFNLAAVEEIYRVKGRPETGRFPSW